MTAGRAASDEARHAVVAALIAEREPIAARIVERARAEMPSYAEVDPAEVFPATLAMIELLMTMLDEQRQPTEPEVAFYSEYGALRARQGVSLVEVLRAWRMAVRMILDEMATVGRREQATDRVLLDLTHELLDTVDVAILGFTGGHREVELALAREDQQRRADFVRRLLNGLLGPAEIHAEAPRHGLDIDREYVAFRARPTGAVTLEVLQRALDGDRPHAVTATVDGDLAGVVDRLWPDPPAVAIGHGPPARLDRLQPSFTMAGRALATAAAFGRTGCHDLGQLGVLPAVLADAEVGDELVRRYLTPLGEGASADAITDTVRCYLDTGMRVDQTAQQLVVHPNTVRYRIGRFQELTGTDLRQPRRTLEVWWALQRITLNSTE